MGAIAARSRSGARAGALFQHLAAIPEGLDLEAVYVAFGSEADFAGKNVAGKGVFSFDIMGIKPDGAGNVTHSHVLYNESKGGGYVPSPIAQGDYIYLVNDGGLASCREARTGKLQWLERLGKHHSASPVAIGGYLFFPDDDGITHVIKAGPKFEILAENNIDEYTLSSIAVSEISMPTTRAPCAASVNA